MALLDSITGDNDYKRLARANKAASEAAAEVSREKARAQRAMADNLERQAAAEEEARENATHQAFIDKMSGLTFAGDTQSVVADMEKVYQTWLSNNFTGNDKHKKAQKKILEEKLEYGLMTLKGLDTTKGAYYEEKINAEKLSRKKKAKLKVILCAAGVVAVIILFAVLKAFGL